jgi:hypothetical protein
LQKYAAIPNAVLESIGVGPPVIGADVMGIADILLPEMLFPLDDIQRAAELVCNCTSRGEVLFGASETYSRSPREVSI